MNKYDKEFVDYASLKISDLKKVADYWLRKYLLSKATKMGSKFFCPIKQKWYSESKIHVAHFIDRSVMCTRYDLDNCNLLSEQSNVWDSQVSYKGYKSKHHYDYEKYLGEKKVKKLHEKSKEICIFVRRDYIDIIENFKSNVN